MNDRDTLGSRSYTGDVKQLLLALLLLAFPVAALSAEVISGPLLQCAAAGDPAPCRPIRLDGLRIGDGETRLVRRVDVPAEALPLDRPLTVFITAMASSEVSWNGEVIGRNGVPGSNRAHERPGRFIATFPVPKRLVRPGANWLSARMSSNHLWLPVRQRVHVFEVGPYAPWRFPGLTHYLPALMALGALGATGVWFAVIGVLDRSDLNARQVAAIAALAVAQLVAETSRTFVGYAYPWHLARVLVVAVLSAATAVLIAAYAGRRFAPTWGRAPAVATALTGGGALLFLPGYDIKAMVALAAGAVALLACAAWGVHAGAARSRVGVSAGVAWLSLMAVQQLTFLDQAYYLGLAALLVMLAAEQAPLRREVRRTGAAQALEADLPERRAGPPAVADTVTLKEGARIHVVMINDILAVEGADDYCEVRLASGGKVLVTRPLGRLHASLPAAFLRVHKSFLVNTANISRMSPRAGGGWTLQLVDGSQVPVGRSRASAVRSCLDRASALDPPASAGSRRPAA